VSGFDFAALSQHLKDAAAADDAAREARKQEANDKLDDWGNAVDHVLPGAGKWLAGMSKLALAAEGKIVQWVQGDWNSDDQKARALAAAKKSIERGLPPRQFSSDIDFAKTYADDLDADLQKVDELDPKWRVYVDDYLRTLQAHTSDSVVMSSFVNAAGAFSRELGTELLCSAIATYASGAPTNYGLANLLAALASARDGTPLSSTLATAYAALGKLTGVHATICTGRGYKGDANTWDYDHAPELYLLQAWIDLASTPRQLVKVPSVLAAFGPSKPPALPPEMQP
jgi:hypothetical protein